MALTRSYQPSIYGKQSKKAKLKKQKNAKKTIAKLLLNESLVQEILNKKLAEIKAKSAPKKRQFNYVKGMKSQEFYKTREWLELRYKVLAKYGRLCQCCKTTNAVFHVDHIKPRSLFPELELDINNLQVLCESCNIGKSNKDVTDWR